MGSLKWNKPICLLSKNTLNESKVTEMLQNMFRYLPCVFLLSDSFFFHIQISTNSSKGQFMPDETKHKQAPDYSTSHIRHPITWKNSKQTWKQLLTYIDVTLFCPNPTILSVDADRCLFVWITETCQAFNSCSDAEVALGVFPDGSCPSGNKQWMGNKGFWLNHLHLEAKWGWFHYSHCHWMLLAYILQVTFKCLLY